MTWLEITLWGLFLAVFVPVSWITGGVYFAVIHKCYPVKDRAIGKKKMKAFTEKDCITNIVVNENRVAVLKITHTPSNTIIEVVDDFNKICTNEKRSELLANLKVIVEAQE